MGFIVQSTGTFTSGFVLMIALAVVGAVAMLFGTKEPASYQAHIRRTEEAVVEE